MSGFFGIFKGNNKPKNAVSYLIVGLGNPTPKYFNTRHNIGFKALDIISYFNDTKIQKNKFESLIGECLIAGKRCVLVKPLTFMNESGMAVELVKNHFKIDIEHVIVLVDDINLPVGKIRIRRGGSCGGHNGLKSIIYSTGEDNFPRIRIGVGNKPSKDYDLAKWVLSKFTTEETEPLNFAMDNVNEAVNLIVEGQIEKAMNMFN